MPEEMLKWGMPAASPISDSLLQALFVAPVWSRTRRHTLQGRNIEAVALHRWSRGAFGYTVLDAQTSNKHLCLPTVRYATHRHGAGMKHYSWGRDGWSLGYAGNNLVGDSYSFNPTPSQTIPALSATEEKLVQQLVSYLEKSIPPTKEHIQAWLQEANDFAYLIAKSHHRIELDFTEMHPVYDDHTQRFVGHDLDAWSQTNTGWPDLDIDVLLTYTMRSHYSEHSPPTWHHMISALQRHFIQYPHRQKEWTAEHIAGYLRGKDGPPRVNDNLPGVFYRGCTTHSWPENDLSDIDELNERGSPPWYAPHCLPQEPPPAWAIPFLPWIIEQLQQAPYDRHLYYDARRDIPWLWYQLSSIGFSVKEDHIEELVVTNTSLALALDEFGLLDETQQNRLHTMLSHGAFAPDQQETILASPWGWHAWDSFNWKDHAATDERVKEAVENNWHLWSLTTTQETFARLLEDAMYNYPAQAPAPEVMCWMRKHSPWLEPHERTLLELGDDAPCVLLAILHAHTREHEMSSAPPMDFA